jgi:hypothetical protein
MSYERGVVRVEVPHDCERYPHWVREWGGIECSRLAREEAEGGCCWVACACKVYKYHHLIRFARYAGSVLQDLDVMFINLEDTDDDDDEDGGRDRQDRYSANLWAELTTMRPGTTAVSQRVLDRHVMLPRAERPPGIDVVPSDDYRGHRPRDEFGYHYNGYGKHAEIVLEFAVASPPGTPKGEKERPSACMLLPT